MRLLLWPCFHIRRQTPGGISLLTVETGLKDTVNSEYRGSVWQLIVHCKVLGGGGRLQCEFVEAQKGGFCTGWKNEKWWKNLVGNPARKRGIGLGGWFVSMIVSVLSAVVVVRFPKQSIWENDKIKSEVLRLGEKSEECAFVHTDRWNATWLDCW